MTVLERPTVDNGIPIGSRAEAALVVWWMASWISPAPPVSMVHLYLLDRLACHPYPRTASGAPDHDAWDRMVADVMTRQPIPEQGSLW